MEKTLKSLGETWKSIQRCSWLGRPVHTKYIPRWCSFLGRQGSHPCIMQEAPPLDLFCRKALRLPGPLGRVRKFTGRSFKGHRAAKSEQVVAACAWGLDVLAAHFWSTLPVWLKAEESRVL